MKLSNWDVNLLLWHHPHRSGWVGCCTYRTTEGKCLSLVLTVPWLFYSEMSFWRDAPDPVPMMFVDVDGIIEVPATLGNKAPGAVTDALIEMVEARRWRCGVGVGVKVHVPEEDEDEDE